MNLLNAEWLNCDILTNNLLIYWFSYLEEKKTLNPDWVFFGHALDTDSLDPQTKTLTWSLIAQEAPASFLHLHVSAELFTTQNMGKKWMFKFGESTGKLGLKMTNRTHWWKENGATLLFGAWLCYIYVYIYIYQSEYVSMVRWVSTREVALYFGF